VASPWVSGALLFSIQPLQSLVLFEIFPLYLFPLKKEISQTDSKQKWIATRLNEEKNTEKKK
jgi:hypothetical protein